MTKSGHSFYSNMDTYFYTKTAYRYLEYENMYVYIIDKVGKRNTYVYVFLIDYRKKEVCIE